MNKLPRLIPSLHALLVKLLWVIWALWANMASASSLQKHIEYSQSQPIADLKSRSVFSQSRVVNNVSLSPDGLYVSYIKRLAKHDELWLFSIKDSQSRMLFSNKQLINAHWSEDSQFIFVENEQGVVGTPISEDGLANWLVKLDESKDQYFYGVDTSQQQAIIVSEKNQTSLKHQLFRVLPDGAKQLVYSSDSRVLDFLFDSKNKLSFIIQQSAQGTAILDLRGNAIKRLKECGWYDNCSLQSFDEAQQTLYVKGRFEQDLISLFAISLVDLQTHLVHQDPQQRFELAKVYFDAKQQPRIALYEDHYVSQYGLDGKAKSVLSTLNKRTKTLDVEEPKWLFKPSRDLNTWLLMDISSTQAEYQVWIYQEHNHQLVRLIADKGHTATHLQHQTVPQPLPAKIAIDYVVSDGKQQFGYLTLPFGRDISQVPLVVKPHGGPWSRANGSYDVLTQLLANRGYAVFEPNFRASTGMGKDYVLSAKQNFGKGRVQQDIIDGLEFVLSQGVGDKNKLAIFGHSFGGFSTLNALAFTPNLFKVGIAGAPPTDISQSIKMFVDKAFNDHDKRRAEHIKKLAVDPSNSAAMQTLYQNSPNAHWQAINQPLYVWAGAKDKKVAIAQVNDFVTRLSTANKPISLLVDKQEGHSPKRDIARQAYFYLLEKALAAHLNGSYQQDISAKLRSYLSRNILVDHNGLTPQ